MQLFITPFIESDNLIIIDEERVFSQVTKVLRWKIWMQFFIQQPIFVEDVSEKIEKKNIKIKRYLVQLEKIEKNSLSTKVISKEEYVVEMQHSNLCVALLNKTEKMELIVQKTTEMWLQHLYFFVSDNSQIKILGDGKIQRMKKIALEAVEQSFWFLIPQIVFEKKVFLEKSWWEKIFFDLDWNEKIKDILSNIVGEKHYFNGRENVYFFIWPEWWWSSDEKKFIFEKKYKKCSLWKTVLRAETAAIVLAWELVS